MGVLVTQVFNGLSVGSILLLAALGLAPGEPVAGVAGPARVGRERRRQMGDSQAAGS